MDYYHDIKFILEIDVNEYSIEDAFNNAKDILNWQFDENSNAIQTDGEIDYQIKDVFNLKESAVEEIIDSFFDFGFKDVIGVPLYRFLLLKDNEKQKILSIINSLIFDYSSINDFYELFENPEKSHPEYNQDSYHKDIQDYLNSSDFGKDSSYWKNHIQNSNRHIKFYNIKNNRYKSQKISPNSNSVSVFIENHGCSLFDFYGSVFSLYLSRIDRLDGCLLKTIIPRRIDLESFGNTTYLKIDVNNDDSFNDLIDEFNSTFKDALNHGKVDVDNYLDENVSYYSIYDFNDLNENIAIYNGEDSALTLNIYKNCLELVYNCELFSAEYISHMAKNIESLIHNLLNSPNQEISDVDILSDEEKSLLCDYCKGKTIEVDEDKILSQSFREYAIKNPDNIAVDDGISQISYGELEKSSNSIANDLQKNHEIKPGYRVGLMLLEIIIFLN